MISRTLRFIAHSNGAHLQVLTQPMIMNHMFLHLCITYRFAIISTLCKSYVYPSVVLKINMSQELIVIL